MGEPELTLLTEAFQSNWIAPLGPHVDAFEAESAACAGATHAAALSSGTAALHLALVLLGVGQEDEVICSDLTFAASAFAIRYVGAEPVFIDAATETWTMDPNLLEQELKACAAKGTLPKAAIIVDLYGQSADYDALCDLCDQYEVPVIEDAAEALGSTYKERPVGNFGRFGVFSFNGNKIITTSGGGMLVSDDQEAISRARFLASQARDPEPHYEHSTLGYNYRLSNLLAAVGRAQLANLPNRVQSRRANFDHYHSALSSLPGITFMPEAEYGESNRWLTCCTIDPSRFGAAREDLRLALEAQNIEARPVWKPMHLQPVFSDCRVRGGSVGRELFRDGLCLPSGSALTRSDRQRVIDCIADQARP